MATKKKTEEKVNATQNSVKPENSVDDLAVAMMVIDTKLNKLIELLGPMAKYVEARSKGEVCI